MDSKAMGFGVFRKGKSTKSFRNMVARDGIEPPTPAFSVLTLCLINRHKTG